MDKPNEVKQVKPEDVNMLKIEVKAMQREIENFNRLYSFEKMEHLNQEICKIKQIDL